MSKTVSIAVFFLIVSSLHAQEFISDPNSPVLQHAQVTGRADTEYTSLINLAIEVGHRSPIQELMVLDSAKQVRLRLEGPAQFFDSTARPAQQFRRSVVYRGDVVRLPEITPGSDVDSRLYVEVEGSPAWDPIRISSIPEGLVESYWLKLDSLKDLILRVGAERKYVLVDVARVDWEKVRVDSQQMEEDSLEGDSDLPGMAGGDCDPFEYGPELVGGPDDCEDYYCPPSIWAAPLIGFLFQRELCTSVIALTGAVRMTGSIIPGYSFKPETGSTLAQVVLQFTPFVDGLYRDSWGCNKALKIPDNTVAEVGLVSAGCCQGLVAWALNKRCEFINPSQLSDWPNCPL